MMASSSSPSKQIPDDIKKSVRAVLLSKIGGVPLDRFHRDYKHLAGSPLNFSELGFKTLRDCLESMPDVVRFQYCDNAKLWMLYGIGDPNSFMSSAAKKAQYPRPNDGIKEKNKMTKGKGFKGRKGSKGASSPPAQTDGSGDRLRIPVNLRGLYSICVRCEQGSLTSTPTILEEIEELFMSQGDVVETSKSGRLLFFRFRSEDEALSVVQQYDGFTLKSSHVIIVGPAKEKTEDQKKHQPMEEKKKQQPAKVQIKATEYVPQRNCEIVVSKLKATVTQEELLRHFQMFDPVRVKIQRIRSDDKIVKRTFGFVNFRTPQEASDAEKALNGSYLGDVSIHIEQARPQHVDPKSSSQDKNKAKNNGKAGKMPQQDSKNTATHHNSLRLSDVGDVSDQSCPEHELVNGDSDVPYIHNTTRRDSNNTSNATQNAHSSETSDKSLPFGALNGGGFGRGRGASLSNLKLSMGRGVSQANSVEGQKKPRPSLADLTDRFSKI